MERNPLSNITWIERSTWDEIQIRDTSELTATRADFDRMFRAEYEPRVRELTRDGYASEALRFRQGSNMNREQAIAELCRNGTVQELNHAMELIERAMNRRTKDGCERDSQGSGLDVSNQDNGEQRLHQVDSVGSDSIRLSGDMAEVSDASDGAQSLRRQTGAEGHRQEWRAGSIDAEDIVTRERDG